MDRFRVFSAAEQVAQHLRKEILKGVWLDIMPGVGLLAKELGVNHKTVESALTLLEKQGVLENQGPRRARLISLDAEAGVKAMRISIMVPENEDKKEPYMLDLYHQLLEAGYPIEFSSKTLHGLGRDVGRLARFVARGEADAWVVLAGSREELNWFAENDIPVFALFGRARQLPVAGIAPDKIPAMRKAVTRLVQLGHRRIVLMVRPERRDPEPGYFERAFFEELESHGIPPGRYHLPDWDESPEGFRAGLEALFRVTPPTALFIDEPVFVPPTLHFCLRQGIQIPEDVSVLCTDPDPSFGWCVPSMAHIDWDSAPWIRRALKWAGNVSRGKKDIRQSFSKSRFVDGGTLGRAPRVRAGSSGEAI